MEGHGGPEEPPRVPGSQGKGTLREGSPGFISGAFPNAREGLVHCQLFTAASGRDKEGASVKASVGKHSRSKGKPETEQPSGELRNQRQSSPQES